MIYVSSFMCSTSLIFFFVVSLSLSLASHRKCLQYPFPSNRVQRQNSDNIFLLFIPAFFFSFLLFSLYQIWFIHAIFLAKAQMKWSISIELQITTKTKTLGLSQMSVQMIEITYKILPMVIISFFFSSFLCCLTIVFYI